MYIGDDRIITQVLSGPTIGPDMQPVFIGHCPGKANAAAVLEDAFLKNRLQQMGYSERLDSFLESDDTVEQLYMLPLPIRSLAQFQRLFPAAQLQDNTLSNGLELNADAPSEHWLPWAIKDYFNVGSGQSDDRICWVIRIDETLAADGFDANSAAVRHLPESWNALELACSIDSAGILLTPDLERLLIPRTEKDISRKRLPNPSPAFHACSEVYDDTHRERRYSTEMPDYSADEKAVSRIQRVAQRLHAWRPDMQWIFSLAPQVENGIARPEPVSRINQWLKTTAKEHQELAGVQFVFPLVYAQNRPLSSASGLLAGHIVNKTRSEGVWRSIAGMPLSSELSLWPDIGKKHRSILREQLGLGVLYAAGNNLQLDDERLVVKGFCDHAGTACRSAELVRFIGWLHRTLRDLGEDLIFNLDGRDPVVGNILDAFFRELHQKGALRGVQSEDAYRLTNLSTQANLIHYQIEIAPSFPVDRFIVSFMHDSKANSPNLVWEVAANA